MDEHDPETVSSDREKKDAYEEFEDRVRRIGLLLLSGLRVFKTRWNELYFHQQAGHFLAFATLVALVVYTGYTIEIYKASNRSAIAAKVSAEAAKGAADTAHEALVIGQRAYMVDSFTQAVEGQFLRVTIRWENKGETPTNHMTMHMSQSGIRHSPLPDNFDFPNTWEDGKDHGGISVTAGAKSFLNGIELHVPLAKLQHPPSYLYVWGWARYSDVFKGTPEHETRFCEEFDTNEMNPSKISVHSLEVKNACYRYNCVDDECKN
ncbi:MAG: hypothetical protein LAO24_00850 [Acidobacteriia bacterium]|nr:hypothetical protein [Terriglobia bacterium]